MQIARFVVLKSLRRWLPDCSASSARKLFTPCRVSSLSRDERTCLGCKISGRQREGHLRITAARLSMTIISSWIDERAVVRRCGWWEWSSTESHWRHLWIVERLTLKWQATSFRVIFPALCWISRRICGVVRALLFIVMMFDTPWSTSAAKSIEFDLTAWMFTIFNAAWSGLVKAL